MKFGALESWRGVLALLVAAYHLTAAGAFYGVPLIRHGDLAVPFFFVLSGFVLTHAYGERLNTGRDAARFAIRRFGRLYPLHIATLMAVLGLELIKWGLVQHGMASDHPPFTGSSSLPTLAANLVLLQAVISFGEFSWNIPSWSISVEAFVCAAYALLALAAGSRLRVAVRWAFAVFAVLVIAYDLSGLKLHIISGQGLLEGLFGFLAGAVAYQVFIAVRERGRAGVMRWPTVFEAAALAAAFTVFWFRPPGLLIPILTFAAVILIFAGDAGRISAALNTAVPRYLGRISYSIYLVHFVLLMVLNRGLRVLEATTEWSVLAPGDVIAFGPPGAMDGLLLIYLLAVIGLASLTYRWIEVPGRRVFERVAERGWSGFRR